MAETHSKEKTQVVASGFGRRDLSHSQKTIVTAVIILFVAGVLGTAVWTYNRSVSKKTVAKSTETVSTNDDATSKIAFGDYEGAKKAIDADPSLKGSRDGQMLLASAATGAGRYDESTKIYTSIADTYGWTPNIAENIADNYAQKGDKAQAIVYLQKAIELLNANTDNPLRAVDIDDLNAQIKELQK